jgi:hypothetical protein
LAPTCSKTNSVLDILSQKNDLFGAREDGAEVLHIGPPQMAPKPEALFGARGVGAEVHWFGAG